MRQVLYHHATEAVKLGPAEHSDAQNLRKQSWDDSFNKTFLVIFFNPVPVAVAGLEL
jgi:hypothetical protein